MVNLTIDYQLNVKNLILIKSNGKRRQRNIGVKDITNNSEFKVWENVKIKCTKVYRQLPSITKPYSLVEYMHIENIHE